MQGQATSQQAKNAPHGNGTNRRKLEDALETLATASRETKDDVAELLRERYSDLKDDFKNIFGGGMDFRGNIEDLKARGQQAWNRSRTIASDTAHRVDDSVRENPWMYLGGTALAGLILGLMIGRRMD